jgi:CMP-2-keto-3-deoxyoctulosonic acid synthetase
MLEQLRGLYHGIPYLVHVEEVPDRASTIEVNTPEDLEFATAFARENNL